MSEVAKCFGRNLLSRRKQTGFSQEELGFRAGLHRTEVSLLERGTRIPRIDTVVKLAGALEISPSDLLDGMAWNPGTTTEGRFIETAVPGLGLVTRRFEIERHGGGTSPREDGCSEIAD